MSSQRQIKDMPMQESVPPLPAVRVPLRVKISFPYVFLALVFALVAAYVVSQVTFDSVQERFLNQLIDTGKLASDWSVQEESRLLETLRFLANTQGMADAIANRDSQRLIELAYPVALNAGAQTVDILDANGASLLSLRQRQARGNLDVLQDTTSFSEWEFVARALSGSSDSRGDKYAGLVQSSSENNFYVAGPVYRLDGKLVGVVLVGMPLDKLVQQARQDLLVQMTIYNLTGVPLVSTLQGESLESLTPEEVARLLAQSERASLLRDLHSTSTTYSEIVSPWQVRGEEIGLMGISLPQTSLVHASQITRLQIFILVALAILAVVSIGIYLAGRITRSLSEVVSASAEVLQGNLTVSVKPIGNDEVTVLASAFNNMVSGLREGSVYRDLLGRTVSPEVRDQLRQNFASGNLRLEGQEVMASLLIADIHDFTGLSEKAGPMVILAWLNEYFGELVPVVLARGGVINEFMGDSLLAFFGILPRPLAPEESAQQACHAALEMLATVEQYNMRRVERGDPPLVTGIAINTGLVTAGSLGTADRLHYTIIGDTVNTTQRMEKVTREFGGSGIVVSHYTWLALRARQDEFCFEGLGDRVFKGKAEQIPVYRLLPSVKGESLE